MKRFFLVAALLCGAAPLGALAQPAAPAKVCLQPINLYDFKPVPGNRALIVIDRSRQKYRVNFQGICSNLQYHLGVAFKTFGSNLSCVSKGDSVIVRDVVGPPTCIIKSVEAYTPAMEKADMDARAAMKKPD